MNYNTAAVNRMLTADDEARLFNSVLTRDFARRRKMVSNIFRIVDPETTDNPSLTFLLLRTHTDKELTADSPKEPILVQAEHNKPQLSGLEQNIVDRKPICTK